MGSTFDFDVAVSFADEDRSYVSEVVVALHRHGVRVFYDAHHAVSLWGKDLVEAFDDIYRRRSKFVVIFVSAHYARKRWTRRELQSALARALQERREYVLPARFDDSDLPGLPPTVGHIDCRRLLPAQVADIILRKLREKQVGDSKPPRPPSPRLASPREPLRRLNADLEPIIRDAHAGSDFAATSRRLGEWKQRALTTLRAEFGDAVAQRIITVGPAGGISERNARLVSEAVRCQALLEELRE